MSAFATRECVNQSHDDHPCDPVPNGDGTATCSACGWTGGFPDPPVALSPASAFPDGADRELAWETLRSHADRARAESALQALDRIFDRYDAAQEMLALCAADTTAVGLRQTIACIEAVLDRFAEINAARENPSEMVTDLIRDVRFQMVAR